VSPGTEGSTLITGTFPVFDTAVAAIPSAPAERTLVSRAHELLVSEKLNRALNFSIALIALVLLAPLAAGLSLLAWRDARRPGRAVRDEGGGRA
jgi:hypothetical protein